MLITLAGTIAAGKSSLTKILSEHLGTKGFYEPVDDNPVLPLFYDGNAKVDNGTWETNPYAFALQIFFLNRRFKAIKTAMQQNNNVLDRSIYEDRIFAEMNYQQGKMSQIEWNMYTELFDNMMEELPYAAHQKAPDLMIWIKLSLPTMLKRVQKRGRTFEQLTTDPHLKTYYQDLIQRYEQWGKDYNISPLLVIDGDHYDFVDNSADRKHVLHQIDQKLLDLKLIDNATFDNLQAKI